MRMKSLWLVGIAVLAWVSSPAASAEEDWRRHVQAIFPSYDTLGEFERQSDKEPPSAAVSEGGKLLGYVFFTDEVEPIPAYSGKPIRSLVGIDPSGAIRGVRVVSHEEPILAVGIKEADLAYFVSQYRGIGLDKKAKIGGGQRPGRVTLDGISGATITVMVINASVVRSVRKVAAARGIQAPGSPPVSTQESTQDSTPAGVEPGDDPIWMGTWQDQRYVVSAVLAALFLLGFILVFQDWLARHPYLLTRVRNAYLLFTLLVIGWGMLGQLSVVNVLTFISAIIHDFKWDTFLADPATFLLWGFVAVTLLLWGRGVYCGWLCPFGALQELLNKAARRLNIPQLELPDMVHERLLALKYIIFIMLFGLSLQSLGTVLPFIEVEPFKTAVTMRFEREWPFLLYALALIFIAVFNRKFYCKYLCPLGAALAIPARLRLFDWLRRRKECGRPCQTCATECEVRAIRPTGEIDVNECHYCLDCQVTYWSDQKCPPLVDKRKRLERRASGKPAPNTGA